MRHARCPPTVSQAICCLSSYYCCYGEQKQGEQILPGSDEDAGTWPSGSILRGLLPHSLFAVSSLAPSVGVKMRTIAWSRSPSAEVDILIDLHTLALTLCLRCQPIRNHTAFEIMCTCINVSGEKGVCRSDARVIKWDLLRTVC